MKKHFYSHLINIESVTVKLDRLNLTKKEKEHLLNLVQTNVHTIVLDTVLSHVPREDRKMFFNMMEQNDHDQIWNFLNKRSINLEEKIKRNTKALLIELEKDIEEHQ